MRKFLCAAIVTVCAVTIAMADEYAVTITKISKDGEITATKKGKKGQPGEAVTLKMAKDAKIVKGKFDPDTKKMVAGDAYEGGLTALNEAITKAGEKGIGATVVTKDGSTEVTEIRVGGGKKKKKGA